MSEEPSTNRSTRLIPVQGNAEAPLYNTPTQKEMAAVVSRSVRPTVQRVRGCGFRALFLDTPLVEFCERATIEMALRMGLARSGGVLIDLGFDDGAIWENLFVRLGRETCSAPIHLVALRDRAGPEEERARREAYERLTTSASAQRLKVHITFDTMAPANWPGERSLPADLPILINACFALHHVPDDGFDESSTRTLVLRRLRRLGPMLIVCGEPDFGPFAERRGPQFGAVPNPAAPIAEAIEALRRAHSAWRGGPSPYTDPEDVRTPPPVLLQGAPVPTERPEEPDRMENWRRRFHRAGFVPALLAPVRSALVSGLHLPPSAVVAPDREALRLTWQGKPLVSVSAWRPAD